MAEANAETHRLPRCVEPDRYELTLTPDLEEARFSGEVKIAVTVHEPVQTILMNAAELSIHSAELVADDGTKIPAASSVDEQTEVATITLASAASPGPWILQLTFTGILNDKLRGFYRSKFKDDDGNERVIATTQFEATDARRAFPCWDEPDFKAIFGVTLIVDSELSAFSNAQVAEDTDLGNGKRQVTFADTMKMSTYLVAFIIGPLGATETLDVEGVPLRVASVPGRERLASFALEAGSAALRYFAEYFKIAYPGGKLDMIALPDFAFGAMENLGCVTFRETALLVDTDRASRLEVERVADVVAHEIAHMWFGDLVTMKWWNGIWLNEAFATLMELLFVDRFRPEWERWVSFGLGKAAAMNIDSLKSTRPIEFEVRKPEEAQGMFDLLTYEKGAAVLRMLEQHLGGHEFATGISKYLHDHAYGNAETTDLWDALEATSEQPVRSMMDTWIFQGGHPIVHVEGADGGSAIRITQRRFRYIEDSSASDSPLWHIPVGVRAMVDNEIHQQKMVLTGPQATIQLPGKAEWLVVNERAFGFYRVSYASDLLRRLMDNVHALDPLERFTLANDTWAACLSGQVSLEDVLALTDVMKGDDDPNVWGALVSPLRLLDKMVPDELRGRLEGYVRKVARPQHEWLGWKPHQGESERLATLRGLLIATLGTLGNDTDVQREAVERYDAYAADPSSLDPNLVEPVQTTLAATDDPRHYERLYAKFSSAASTPQEKVNALQALACFKNKSLVERTLSMISSGEVRTQDAPYTIRIMLSQRMVGLDVWDWCAANWDTLMERFPDNSIARMFDGVTAQVDPDFAARVQAFMQSHPVPQAQKSIDQSCERLRVNVKLNQTNASRLADLFG